MPTTNVPTQFISLQEAQSNKDYWEIMENAFGKQAVVLIQRQWRAKSGTNNASDTKEKSTNKSSYRLRFIREPQDTRATEIAQYIKTNRLEDLNPDEPELIRNIYKACRLGDINKNDMVTALFAIEAQLLFGRGLKKHSFNEKSTSLLEQCSYASKQTINATLTALKQLPHNENCYFTFNLPRQFASICLYDSLMDEFNARTARHLTAYLSSITLSEEEYATCKKFFAAFNGADHEQAVDYFKKLIISHETDFNDDLSYSRNKNIFYLNENSTNIKECYHSSLRFLTIFLRKNYSIPTVDISPDFDPTDPNSPLLCFVLPTISAYNCIQKNFHGEHDNTEPYFTTGEISTRMIRELDENPGRFNKTQPARPVELVHPDIESNKAPHGFSPISNLLLSIHDLFHCWLNSQNTQKDFIRYLRKYVAVSKGFDMSKSIWKLTDLDFDNYSMFRDEIKNNSQIGISIHTMQGICSVIHKINPNFWIDLDQKDTNLLVFIDMIMNQTYWDKLLENIPIREAFKLDKPLTWRNIEINVAAEETWCFVNFDMEKIQSILTDIEQIKTQHPQIKSDSKMFYVLAYRLKNIENSYQLCEKLDEIGLDKLFQWRRNDGLELIERKEILENLSDQELYECLTLSIGAQSMVCV